MPRPEYDFDHPVFKTKRNWLLYAKEHVDLYDLKQNSDVIDWEVKSTVSALKIPTVYHVSYQLRSIIAIDEESQPIYGDRHIMELTIPTRYPLVPAAIFMRTDVWHPNIQSVGRFKGKICGNVNSYGVDYSLYQLVLRVGEILQYKNYLADFVPPYPEDPKVAEWVKAYAEPRDIVNRKKGIATDDRPLIRRQTDTIEPAARPDPSPEQEAAQKPPVIRIGSRRPAPTEADRKVIRIGKPRIEKEKE
jgi:ubiquitin-protein ligase